ncbi:MAG TPA: AsmA family protein [Terracidiphilus sp.]|nr:AsmA family protein [Terracidiphilus sp.]
MKKGWIKWAAVAAGVVIVILIILPFLVNADTFRPMVQNELSSALGRQVTLGHLGFSPFSGSLVANDISIADDPAFSNSPFIGAKSFYIGVEVMPLVFHHDLRITKLTIDSPTIQLVQNAKGVWNFSSLGGASSSSKSGQPSAIPNFSVGELAIKDGSATESSIPATGKPFVYSKVNLQVKNFSFANSFPFNLSANLPGDGSLKLDGTAGPISRTNAADTPFRATLDVKHLDPVAAGLVDRSTGISMVAEINASVESNGTTATSSGKISAAKLQLSRTGSPAAKPVNIDYNVTDNLDARTGQVTDLAIHTGSVAVHATGSFRQTAKDVELNLKVSAPNMPVDQLVELLPVVGVRLPSGSSLQGGTLSANLAVTGPATATTIAGPVEIDNTKLVGFDLGSKIEGLAHMGGTSGGTAIQTLKTTVNSTPSTTQFANILGVVPAIGTATGSGSVSAAGDLNFDLTAKLNGTTGVAGAMSKAATTFGGLFGKAVQYTQQKGVPMTITGTASNPKIRANVKAMLR